LDNDKIKLTENFFELHGQGNLNNIDVTEWAANDEVKFRVGGHTTREARDWSIVIFKYPGKGVESSLDNYECIDGYSSIGHHDTWDKMTISKD